MTNKPDNSPGTPTRAVKASGGGSKKLQQLLGASESDIDLLLRPAEIVSTYAHRVRNLSKGWVFPLVVVREPGYKVDVEVSRYSDVTIGLSDIQSNI